MQWEILEAITELLHPFAQAVMKLEGEKYVTISEVYPTLYSLIKKLEAQRQRRFLGIVALAKNLIVQIKQRFARVLDEKKSDFDPVFVLATLLDPQYALLLEGGLLKAAEDELQRMVTTYYNTGISIDTAAINVPLQNAADDLLAVARAKIEERRQMDPQTDTRAIFENEFKMYLVDAKTVTIDPLEYWKEKKNVMPTIYAVAVDVLAIPATSAPTERVFSKASLVLKKNRHNLSNRKMEIKVFFKFNEHFIK